MQSYINYFEYLCFMHRKIRLTKQHVFFFLKMNKQLCVFFFKQHTQKTLFLVCVTIQRTRARCNLNLFYSVCVLQNLHM